MKTLMKFLFPNLTFYIDEPAGGGADYGDNLVDDAAEAAAAAEAAEQAAAVALAEETTKKDEKPADEKAHTGKGIIPIERHEGILARERAQREALAARLAQFERQNQSAVTSVQIEAAEKELANKEGQYNKLLADGELDKAAALMKDIRMSERAINTQVRQAEMEAVRVMAVEQVRYDTVVERMETAFPEINPDSPEYDNDVALEMRDLSEAYQLKGLTPSAALQKAAKLILEPKTRAQKIATEVNPNASEEDVAAAARALRREAANEKGVDAANKTPPLTTKVGKDSDKAGGGVTQDLQVMKLSQKEFDALDEATLAKHRGDTF
jgi:hypothetical protein